MSCLHSVTAALLALFCFSVSVLPAQATPQSTMVDVGGHKLQV